MLGRLFILFAVLVIIVGVESYAYNAFKMLGKNSANGSLWIWGYMASLAIVLGGFAYTAYGVATGQGSRTPFDNFVVGIAFSIIVSKIVLAVFMFGGDVVRLGEGLFNSLTKKGGEGFMPSRRAFIAQSGMVAAGLTFGAFLYGITKGKYHFKVNKVTLSFPDLPEAFHGFRVAQISDVHSGSFDSPSEVMRGVDMVNAQGADLIVFTGDLVNNQAVEIEPYIPIFKKLSAPEGVYSITGNHDYGTYGNWGSEQAFKDNFSLFLTQHEKMGFRLLRNEHVCIERDGEQICLAGVENWGLPPFPQYGDLDKALEGARPDFTILLSHDPSHWDEKVIPHGSKIHLTLSGHTHGMQMGVDIPGFKWSPVKYRYPRWAGLYETAEQYLYVNRGFGFIGFPGRVGMRPEITVFELQKA